MEKYLFAAAIIFFSVTPTFSQRILGGELRMKIDLVVVARAQVYIYREGIGEPSSILFDWGDGTIDTLEGSTSTTVVPGIVRDKYWGGHIYQNPGTYVIGTIDSFLVADIVNIPTSGSKPLHIRDTFVLPEAPYNWWGLPFFLHSQTNIDVDEEGIVRHSTILGLPEFTSYDSITTSLVPFPADGYTYPEATDSISCCPFVWDRPVAPGRYAFSIRARCWEAGQVSTYTRNMVITIDSSMIVSIPPWLGIDDGLISLYPNPATDLLHLQLGGFHAPVQVRIFDALGREVYETQAEAASQVETLRIPVAVWPPGVYSVQLASGGKVLTRQVVVQR